MNDTSNTTGTTLRGLGALLLCVALLPGCKPETANPSSSPTAPAMSPDVGAEPEADTDSTDDFRSITGRFGDGESILELGTDGRYMQTLQAGGISISAGGTWQALGAGTIALAPDGNPDAVARFDVISADELRAQDGSRTFRRITGD